MNNDISRELDKKIAEERIKEEKERVMNPLSQFSTTQLKNELKRRRGKIR